MDYDGYAQACKAYPELCDLMWATDCRCFDKDGNRLPNEPATLWDDERKRAYQHKPVSLEKANDGR